MKTVSDIHELFKTDVNFSKLTVFNWELHQTEGKTHNRYINNLFYILDCDIEYIQNDQNTILTQNGDIILLPKYSNYKWRLISPKHTVKGICLDFILTDENGEEITFPTDLNLVAKDTDGYFKKMYDQAINSQLDSSGSLTFRSDVYKLIDNMLRYDNRIFSPDYRYRDIVEAISIIEHSPQNNLSIKELANRCNISETHLRQLFKSYTGGLNPVEYRNSLRIKKAKELILNTSNNHSLESIAEMLGYYDASYFIKTFVRYVGMTPREYKNSHANNNADRENTSL